jgi:hypothetical protein
MLMKVGQPDDVAAGCLRVSDVAWHQLSLANGSPASVARVVGTCLLIAACAPSLLAEQRGVALPTESSERADERPAIEPAPLEWRTLGLMRIQDMTPFGLGRLDMLPAHAVPAAPRTYAFELNLSHQNTWALSDNVRDYLEARGVERGALGADAVADILALPGEAFLVDGEFAVVELTLHYRASRHLGLYATLPWFDLQGGFLDGAIESFHEDMGFSSAGRRRVPRDRFLVVADLADSRIVVDEMPSGGFGDPVIGVRYSLLARPARFNLILEGALKASVLDRERFVATGRNDFGVQLSLQRFLRRNAFYLTAAGVYYQTPDQGLASDGWIPTMIVGWETKLTRNTNFIAQAYASRSSVQHSDLDELTATKIQATMGLQRRLRGHVLRFGITENLANYDNTPDVGFNVSVGRIVFGH